MLISGGDAIKCWCPNFVILRKNNILRLKPCRMAKWSWLVARHILYRFQYRKIKWSHQTWRYSRTFISGFFWKTQLEITLRFSWFVKFRSIVRIVWKGNHPLFLFLSEAFYLISKTYKQNFPENEEHKFSQPPLKVYIFSSNLEFPSLKGQ